MNYLLNLVAAVSPTPDQEDGLRPGLDPSQVTPGLLGFLATLALVVAVIFLVRDMSRRIRRVRYQGMAGEQATPDSPATMLDDDRLPDDAEGSPDAKPHRPASGSADSYRPDSDRTRDFNGQ